MQLNENMRLADIYSEMSAISYISRNINSQIKIDNDHSIFYNLVI